MLNQFDGVALDHKRNAKKEEDMVNCQEERMHDAIED